MRMVATAAEPASLATPPSSASTAILGGGPAGLATAIMLAQRGWTDIHVFDRLAPPPAPDDAAVWSETARFYLLGLGGRGQLALQALGCWDGCVKRYTTQVVGRRDWSPGGDAEGVERIFTDRKFATEVIARDRLVGALHEVVLKRYGDAVTLHHGCACDDVAWAADGKAATLQLTVSEVGGARAAAALDADATAPPLASAPVAASVSARLLIGADGTARAVASAIAAASSDFQIVRYPDDNQRVYKTVPLQLPAGWRGDVNYSARTADGRVNFDALPAGADGSYCGVLLLRADDPLARGETAPAELRALLDGALPQFSPLLDDAAVAIIAAKPPSLLPAFRTVRPRLHHEACALLLGDAVHTVKPYFGLGANSAFEDVIVLRDVLDRAAVGTRGAPADGAAAVAADDALGGALAAFSAARADDAAALVRISRGLDRPGWRGLVSFVLPLVLDGICHKLLPSVFAPNTIAMLQRDDWTFTRVAQRKRRDRLQQAGALSIVLGATGALAAVSARALARNLPGRVSLVLLALAAAVRLVKAAVPAGKTRSPADVLYRGEARGKGQGSNEDFLMTQRMGQTGYGKPPQPSA
jgi:2-polyprenyl-6-methoxyphenol hydroxylase-like FAD-dependent oxidoreductase